MQTPGTFEKVLTDQIKGRVKKKVLKSGLVAHFGWGGGGQEKYVADHNLENKA